MKAARFLAVVMDGYDVIVLNGAGHARFVKKAVLRIGVTAAFIGEYLDGNLTADDGIERAVDMGHAAAEELLQLIFSEPRGKVHEQLCE